MSSLLRALRLIAPEMTARHQLHLVLFGGVKKRMDLWEMKDLGVYHYLFSWWSQNTHSPIDPFHIMCCVLELPRIQTTIIHWPNLHQPAAKPPSASGQTTISRNQ